MNIVPMAWVPPVRTPALETAHAATVYMPQHAKDHRAISVNEINQLIA